MSKTSFKSLVNFWILKLRTKTEVDFLLLFARWLLVAPALEEQKRSERTGFPSVPRLNLFACQYLVDRENEFP